MRFQHTWKTPVINCSSAALGNTRDTSKKDLHYIHVLKPITPNGEFAELNRQKWRIINSQAHPIGFSFPNLQILLFLLQEGKAGIALANCWKCFGFPNTYFPAFISSGFPVCFRTFGRELLSSWPPLSDDGTQGSVKTNANHWESLE